MSHLKAGMKYSDVNSESHLDTLFFFSVIMEHSQNRLFFKKRGVTNSAVKEAGSRRAGEDREVSALVASGVSLCNGRQVFAVFGTSFPVP